MKAWWMRWYTPDGQISRFELHSPWWISGYGDNETILVAAVLADTAEEAWSKIRGAYDEPRRDDDVTESFAELIPSDAPQPFDEGWSDRWPKAWWMAWDPANGRTCACEAHTRAMPEK